VCKLWDGLVYYVLLMYEGVVWCTVLWNSYMAWLNVMMELSVIKISRLVVGGMVVGLCCYIDYLFFVCLSAYI
jgi:hypothetical protein